MDVVKNPYADCLAWTLRWYEEIMTKVQPNTDDAKARTKWADECSKDLDALAKKYGVTK